MIIAAGMMPLWVAPVSAQSGPSKLRGPAVVIDDRQGEINRAALSKERFRRRAAEAAQKQLEQLAGQLRDQLGEEVALRKATEARIIELTARLTLTDQLDQERQRLRDDKVQILEQRRALLEREVAALRDRLQQEAAKRQELEKLAENSKKRDAGSSTRLLEARVKMLEKQVTAAEWARKLAEAQLKLVTGGQAQ